MIAVLFEADAYPQAKERYLELTRERHPLLAEIPGFIAIERFESLHTPGKVLSLSWWQDEDAVHQWRSHVLHRQAQQAAKVSIFSFYRIRVARVFRDYSSESHL